MRTITLLAALCPLGLATVPAAAEDFYCQPPEYPMIYNISSGFDAEIADDIPAELAGRWIDAVTLWGGEWFYGGGPTWRDPIGLRLNFYAESCPPEQLPFLTLETSWTDLEKTLVLDSGGMRIYALRVLLAEPLEIGPGMSLGATMLIDWGSDEPFTGLCATSQYESYGACVAYLDAPNWGYSRWTAIDHYTGIAQDLGYCLSASPTGVADGVERGLSLAAHPNPFNPATTIRLHLPAAGEVRLSVHDVEGRRVALLQAGRLEAGEHAFTWRAAELPSGVYFARLSAAGTAVSRRLVLLR